MTFDTAILHKDCLCTECAVCAEYAECAVCVGSVPLMWYGFPSPCVHMFTRLASDCSTSTGWSFDDVKAYKHPFVACRESQLQSYLCILCTFGKLPLLCTWLLRGALSICNETLKHWVLPCSGILLIHSSLHPPVLLSVISFTNINSGQF